MTNSVSGVANNVQTNTYDPNVKAMAGQAFASILQSKVNKSTASIANFDNVGATNNSSSSLFGTGDSMLGGSGGIGGGLSGLMGGGDQSGSSGINSETMLAFLFIMLAMGEGDSANSMLSSITGAMGGNSPYGNIMNRNANSAMAGMNLYNSSYKSTPIAPGKGSYPSSMGNKCSPAVVNNVGSRSATAYNQVVSQFNVEKNPRYTPYKNGSTYCNIYVWDVTTAMGAQIPHRVDANGDIAKDGASNVQYMTANRMYDWLGGKGKEYGWKEVSAEEAQRYANMGSPAVTSWKNPKGHGHIQMVVPSKTGGYDPNKGVAISQAGSKVIEHGNITDVYKGSRLKDIKYFVHA